MMANKGHEAARLECARLVRISVPFEAEQFLIVGTSYRQNQPATVCQLGTKWFGNRGRCRRDEYRLEGSKVRQPKRAVSAMHMNILVSETIEPSSRGGS